MNILIVDDEIKKAQEISQILQKAGIAVTLCHKTTADAARSELREKDYDLLIIDLNLPATISLSPSCEGGFELLEMLLLDSLVKIPHDIIFITGREDLIPSARSKAHEKGATLLEYSKKESWKSFIVGKLKYRQRQIAQANHINVDVAILTALTDPEMNAVLSLKYDWQLKRFKNDPTAYHFGRILRDGNSYSVLAVCAERKGMPASAALAAKVVTKFSPKFLVMLGICAGIKSKTNYGDVIVADPTWDYGSGKHALDGEGSPVFLAAPVQCQLDTQIKSISEQVAREDSTLRLIRAGWDEGFPEGQLSIKVGPMASGASVIADNEQARLVALQQREVIAIEMEAYAVMAAAEFARSPKPVAIAIKSVCDFADSDKCDKWQKYAAYTSAQFAHALFTHPDFPLN